MKKLSIGLFKGFFIAYMGIPPFIVTLAATLMGRDLAYTVLAAQTKGSLPADDTCPPFLWAAMWMC